MIPGMMNSEEKKGIGAILAIDEPTEKEVEPGVESDDEVGFDALCDDIMIAVSTKDGSALKAALRGFVDMVMMSKKSDEASDEAAEE